RLSYTPEYPINPANYVPGSIVFSWYQGNAALGQAFQVVVQVGGTWYASVQTFDNTAAVANAAAFGNGAEFRSFTYNPVATNWLILNFTGSYNITNQASTASSAISLGGTPASDLSGTITAFGLYRNVTGSNGRFDTFTVDATTPTQGAPTITADL